MRSQFITAERMRWSVARYNSNNAWLYNGNNGTLNNNNLYNGYTVRPLDYGTGEGVLSDFPAFLADMYGAYRTARRTKRGKASQMEFELGLTVNLVELGVAVWNREYIPSTSICFMLERPRRREVVAAWFGDRVVQTWYCLKLEQHLEDGYYDPQSYSCRKGKGGLKAVLDLREHIRRETCGYVLDDVWIVKRDIRACFMSVDTAMLEERMVDFIWSVICEDEELRNMLCWLTRVIYRSLPQEHCVIKTNPLAWESFPKEKSAFGKTKGLAIGNRSSQQAVLFLTTVILDMLRERGYKAFSHYTDDTAVVIRDKRQWRIDELDMEERIAAELGWEWHKNKKYIQHYTKGVDFLGYRIRGERILPSKRIAHNYLWKMKCAANKAKARHWYADVCKESLMQTVNSYLGLLKWCDASRLKDKGLSILMDSPFAKVYDFHEGRKVTIRGGRTRQARMLWLNRRRKTRNRTFAEIMNIKQEHQ